MSRQATEFQKKEMSKMYRGKEIFKPLNTGWVDEHVACVREWVANIFFYRKGGTTLMIDAGYNYDRLAEKMGWQGFAQGDRDGCKEWPVPGESLFSYRGKPLLYMAFCCQHLQYWQLIAAESKRTGDRMNSRKLFDDSEAAHPLQEEMVPVERIQGKLLLIGAEDDTLWDAARYIHRMEKRLSEKPHSCSVKAAVYAHGTHFVFPEGMLKTMLPVGSGLL